MAEWGSVDAERIEALSVLRMGVAMTAVGAVAFPLLLGAVTMLLGILWLDGCAFGILTYWAAGACIDDATGDVAYRRNATRVRNLYDWALTRVATDPPWYAFSRAQLHSAVRVVRYTALVWVAIRVLLWSVARDWAWLTAPW